MITLAIDLKTRRSVSDSRPRMTINNDLAAQFFTGK
jgi:hypothetical protein